MLPLVKEKWNRALPFVFVALFALSRWPGLLPWGFSAAYALAFCGGVYLSKRTSWWLPLLVLFATDIGLNFYYQHKYQGINVWSGSNFVSLGFNCVAYAAMVFLGRRFKPQSRFVSLVGGSLLGAVLFYLITNTASWLFGSDYAKTVAGWITALTIGLAGNGFPPTWMFFLNSLLSAGLFTALIVAAEKLTAAAESPQEKEAGNKATEPEMGPEETPEEAKA
jgi:Family of unknown function (DUF6580)